MILTVLPIHVPPCYEGGYLKPTPLKPYMTYDDHHSTSIIRRQCKDKGHSSHPQEKPQSTSTRGGGGKCTTLGGVGGACQTWIIWNTFSCRNKKLTPSNMIGSMMILRVLPIHVPPCYEGGYLKATPLKPYMTYDDHHSTSIIRRQCKDKGHSSHPQEKPQSTFTGGGGGKYITLGGVGGPAKPGSYGIPFHAVTKGLLHLT